MENILLILPGICLFLKLYKKRMYVFDFSIINNNNHLSIEHNHNSFNTIFWSII